MMVAAGSSPRRSVKPRSVRPPEPTAKHKTGDAPDGPVDAEPRAATGAADPARRGVAISDDPCSSRAALAAGGGRRGSGGFAADRGNLRPHAER